MKLKRKHEKLNELCQAKNMETSPLGIATNGSGLCEKVPENSTEQDQKFRKLMQENASLSEKVADLTEGKKRINANLEVLHSEHSTVMQKLSDLQVELKENFTKSSADHKKLRKVHETEVLKYRKELKALQKHVSKIERSNSTYLSENKKLKKNLDTLRDCLTKQRSENVNIKSNLELTEKHLLELNEKLKTWKRHFHQGLHKFHIKHVNPKKLLEGWELNFEDLKVRKELKVVFTIKHRDKERFIVLKNAREELGVNLKQKYNEIFSGRDRFFRDIKEKKEYTQSNEELDKRNKKWHQKLDYQEEQTRLRTKLEAKIKLLAAARSELEIKTQNREAYENIIKEFGRKVSFLKKKKSILEIDKLNNLQNIEKLNI